MSCINITANRVSNPVYAVASKVGFDMSTDVRSVASSIKAVVSNVGENFSVSASICNSTIEADTDDTEEHLNATFGVICMVNKDRFFQITPNHIFLMLSNNYTDSVDVFSNVDWKVLI